MKQFKQIPYGAITSLEAWNSVEVGADVFGVIGEFSNGAEVEEFLKIPPFDVACDYVPIFVEGCTAFDGRMSARDWNVIPNEYNDNYLFIEYEYAEAYMQTVRDYHGT